MQVAIPVNIRSCRNEVRRDGPSTFWRFGSKERGSRPSAPGTRSRTLAVPNALAHPPRTLIAERGGPARDSRAPSRRYARRQVHDGTLGRVRRLG
jgi:hypothetical protein